MAIRQYIGARYVPKFFENSATGDSTWASNTPYEPLTIVTWNNLSYTSKKQVPSNIGAPNLNTEYWILTGDYTGAIGDLSRRMNEAEQDIDELEEDIGNLDKFFLYPTGDTTDRSTEIIEKLTNYGVCFFATGDFYISHEITMPEGSCLMGMGGSNLHLNYAGNLIRCNSFCRVENLRLIGQETPISGTSYSRGDRVAIYIDGDASSISDPGTYTRNNNVINNLVIEDFNSAAIRCYRTGDAQNAGMFNNIIIKRCYVGIDIALFSEFNSFSNVNARGCVIGCVMQGGNNVFSACHFDVCATGVKIDNANNVTINPDHSSFSACTFCHTTLDNGKVIDLTSIRGSLTFVGCTIFHGDVSVVNSDGVIFDGCIIGMVNRNFIMTNCTGCIVANCKFEGDLPTFVTDGSKYAFNDNFNNSGEIIIRNIVGIGSGGVRGTVNTSQGQYLKHGTIATYGQYSAICYNAGMLHCPIPLPFLVEPATYKITISQVIVLGLANVPLSDVTVSAKGASFFRIEFPVTDAAQREAYLVQVGWTLETPDPNA